MIKILSTLSLLLFAHVSFADDCLNLYEKRAEALMNAYQSLDCYGAKVTDEIPIHLFLSASWIHHHESDRTKKINLAQSMLDILEQKNSPFKKYWRGVFLTFRSKEKDGTALIPTETLTHLAEIKRLFEESHQEQAAHHFFGAARNLGTMYMEMPAIAGGSNAKALQYLEIAHNGAPQSTANGIALAKIYIKTGKKESAKPLLTAIVNLASHQMDPAWLPEIREDQDKARNILKGL